MGHNIVPGTRRRGQRLHGPRSARHAVVQPTSLRPCFVNGMGNTADDHRKSALGLSLLQMCPVTGVFNKGGGTIPDLLQCLGDKYQFDGPLSRDPTEALDSVLDSLRKEGRSLSRVAAIESAISRNTACLSLFRVLRQSQHRESPIFAHSQGNLILSNALSAIAAVDGAAAIRRREVHSFGSPSVNWPAGLKHQEYGFTFDPITWLAGIDWSFSISKIGLPHKGDTKLYSHSFDSYVENDPRFVINRFRWGGWGVTFSMDEDGLAAALVQMGRNIPRVSKVFEYLAKHHSSDADDVAVRYVQILRQQAKGADVLRAIKSHKTLHALLIRVMDEGWTSHKEKEAIAFLKSL